MILGVVVQGACLDMAVCMLRGQEHVNVTHLIGAQPVLESYDVFICYWTFPVEIAQGMSKIICKCSKGKGEEQNRKTRTHPKNVREQHV